LLSQQCKVQVYLGIKRVEDNIYTYAQNRGKHTANRFWTLHKKEAIRSFFGAI